MKRIDVPKDLFLMGDFYPFSSDVKQALPFWYSGIFFGAVFQRAEFCMMPALWEQIKKRSDIKDGEGCYWLEFTRVDTEHGRIAGPPQYDFPNMQTVQAAKEKVGLLSSTLLIFGLEKILEKHTASYGAKRYFFDVFGAELLSFYRFIMRKEASYPYRKYDLIYHTKDEWKNGDFSYFELVPRS
ncbi:hypothetical protein [Saccharibacter floricola]|uniref:Uncharacterized protein n=1 Tax=Saccharibacter floricola DSM 15669 TaxID=1123227 RepID=A0ABQ0NY72_9PROT|nr:hypothetical protein [Saccharibacter floricola]GBQ06013.1 hypothetical protein AA15669_0743 [Saccharibacter floricola DSM 15669]